MAATVAELLEQAQREAWDLARARAHLQPGSPMGRARQTWPTLRAHLAAWPALARAGQSTLGVIAVWPTSGMRTPLQRTLERWSDQTPSQDLRSPARASLGQEPDPGVDRITHLVAAVGDLLTDARPARDEEDLTRVLQLKPSEARAHLALGVLQIGQGRLQDARQALDRALYYDPNNGYALTNRALARQGLGDRHGARTDLDHAVAVAPRNSEARNARALLRYAEGRYRDSLEDLDQAIALTPDPDYQANRAVIAAQLAAATPS